MGRSKLFLRIFFSPIFFLKSLNSSSGVQELLFSSKERMTVGADLYMDLLFRTFRLKGRSASTFNHCIKHLRVYLFFHLNSLQSSILLIFRKFSTSFIIIGSYSPPAAGYQPNAASENLLIHGVEKIPIVLGGLHLLQ
jgi:hypothetical protein